MVGMILTGVFATKAVNSAGNDGLFYGNAAFFFTQVKAMAIAVGYSFVMSYAIFKFINFLVPMRVSSEEEELGLDATQHNEAYVQGTLILTKNGEKDREIKIEKGTVEELILD
jgi:ammonium transporter, Amt family